MPATPQTEADSLRAEADWLLQTEGSRIIKCARGLLDSCAARLQWHEDNPTSAPLRGGNVEDGLLVDGPTHIMPVAAHLA